EGARRVHALRVPRDHALLRGGPGLHGSRRGVDEAGGAPSLREVLPAGDARREAPRDRSPAVYGLGHVRYGPYAVGVGAILVGACRIYARIVPVVRIRQLHLGRHVPEVALDRGYPALLA